MTMLRNSPVSVRGFALLQVVLVSVLLSAAVAGLYVFSKSLGKVSATYSRVQDLEAVNRSAIRLAQEVIQSVIVERQDPSGVSVLEADLLTHDLTPNPGADFNDDVASAPDLRIESDGIRSDIDIDYLPLARNFAWTDIEFGTGYHKSSAGGSSLSAQSFRITVLTTDSNRRRLRTSAVYVVRSK